MSLDNIKIVLARPLYGGNVGSVCRAMMNMGFSRLAIVEPTLSLDMGELRKMALNAIPIYEGRQEFGTLADATSLPGPPRGTGCTGRIAGRCGNGRLICCNRPPPAPSGSFSARKTMGSRTMKSPSATGLFRSPRRRNTSP